MQSKQNLVLFKASKRNESGKSAARKLRKEGLLPANLITKQESISITIDPKWLPKAWQQADKRCQVELEGSDNKVMDVVIQELQIDPLKRSAVHVDFIVAPT